MEKPEPEIKKIKKNKYERIFYYKYYRIEYFIFAFAFFSFLYRYYK